MNTYLEVNLENLEKNIQNIKSSLTPNTLLMAVVKSNAYGHGLVECGKTSLQAGANWLGVVNLSEALELRRAGVHKPILILGFLDARDMRQAANQDISVPIISLQEARKISEINFDKPLKVHLKIDTGLGRLGMDKLEITEVIRLFKTNQNIIIEGVYSHLASVEENDLSFAKDQIKEFREAVKILADLGFGKILKHIAASAAALVLPESHFDMVRCGIAIYGLWPSEEIKKIYCSSPQVENFSLTPVLSYKTEIVQVKKVSKGEKIGYGCTYTAKSDMTIGIIPVGYFEGLDRGLSNIGEVLVSGVRCPIVGRICMNMSIIDISHLVKDCPLPEVIIIGKDGDEEITVDEIATKLGTINYEIVARLPEHLERKYV